MATKIEIELTDTQNKALEHIAYSVQDYLDNAAHSRARRATVDIIDKLVKHCNKNSIQLATGESAQVDQAYTLKVVETAKKRTDDAASQM